KEGERAVLGVSLGAVLRLRSARTGYFVQHKRAISLSTSRIQRSSFFQHFGRGLLVETILLRSP
ncbi:hypothetical protein, partial [Sphingomonas echinoides]|uniref:hypothetical protein n=1 Tax=Sphingomonas echinoides TaxID=59803 RepID=UPI0024135E18